MARLTLGDQVSIVSTGEKGTIVGESNGLYDVRIGGAGTMETRRGVRRRDLERFVPEFSSPFNGMVQVNIPGVTGVPMSDIAARSISCRSSMATRGAPATRRRPHPRPRSSWSPPGNAEPWSETSKESRPASRAS